MDFESQHTVLLVCGCEARAEAILGRLFESGISAVGPAATAGHAMTLASQTSTTIAVLATAPGGRRNAGELARDLMATWGVRSWILTNDEEYDGDASNPVWAASAEAKAPLQRALHGLEVFGIDRLDALKN